MTTFNQAPAYSGYIPFNAPPPGGFSPQGFDFGEIFKGIADQAIKALPGLLIGLLSTHPTLGPQLRSQGASPQSISVGIKLFDTSPRVDPLGFNFGKILKDIADQAIRMVPGLLIGALSTHPVLGPQLKSQGVSTQSFISAGINLPFLSGGFSVFDSMPGVSPQGFDLDALLGIVTDEAKRAIPNIVNGLLEQLLPQSAIPKFR
ncbi:hypothetical protein RPMA_04575 [Tardiphaga alba]|uniref:Uncharacterized protein n=1 Tax=Tardiphaga alba TaxID=340268 RepID=A0ABX8A3K2_9BRAD|nr:hypothetical protein [Tardiphaga alba]QUS38204.1 hypothetical protein RPMA_04575 [Tardiphaga alba]